MQHPAMCVSRPLCGSERTEPTPAPTGAIRVVSWAGWGTSSQCYGGHGERETPGLIPNPEAKPFSADGTARGTGWESRTPPDINSQKRAVLHADPHQPRVAAPSGCRLGTHPASFGADPGRLPAPIAGRLRCDSAGRAASPGARDPCRAFGAAGADFRRRSLAAPHHSGWRPRRNGTVAGARADCAASGAAQPAALSRAQPWVLSRAKVRRDRAAVRPGLRQGGNARSAALGSGVAVRGPCGGCPGTSGRRVPRPAARAGRW